MNQRQVNPCRCGHEKGDHQQRLGQRGNYTPCCVSGCTCDGFRKADARPAPAGRRMEYACRCGARFERGLGKYGCPSCSGYAGAADLVPRA